jgi:hypothetical protein
MQKPVLFFIICLAALIRLYNLDHGLPAIYEEATPMRQAWEMWRGPGDVFDFNPHFFNYPALYFYFQFLAQAIYFVLNVLVGRFHGVEDMVQLYESDPTEIVLIARLINMGFGLGSVWATYRLGTLLHNGQTGLLAAGILALTPIPVHTSRIILVDTPLLLFGTLSLIQSIQIFRKNKRLDNLLAGVLIGLASASKYTGALFVIPFLTAHMLRNRSLRSLLHQKKQIAIGLRSAGLIFFATNPYILSNFSAFWADFSFERTHMTLGHFGVESNGTIAAYLAPLWHNFGALLTPFLLWGFVHIGVRAKHNFHTGPVMVFCAVYFTLISTWSMQAPHYLLPILPPLSGVAARYQAHPEMFVPQNKFYEDLEKGWQEMASFSGERFSGPSIHIFKRRGPNDPPRPYAEQQYEKLVGANTRVADDLLARLGSLFTQMAWHDKAIEVYLHLLSMVPQNAGTAGQLGLLFYQTGQIEKAIQAWQRALQSDPKNVALLTNLGASYLQLGNPALARQYLEQGLVLSPADPDVINNLILLYRQNDRVDRAVQILQNALEIAPNNSAF